MFQALGNFFSMFATLFAAGNTAASSLNDFADLGKLKSETMLKEEQLRSSSDLRQLTKQLEALDAE